MPSASHRCCPAAAAAAAVVAPVLLLQMNYNNKNNLVGDMIVAGYDKHNGGQVRLDSNTPAPCAAFRRAFLGPAHPNT
jgi:hypothetical protein